MTFSKREQRVIRDIFKRSYNERKAVRVRDQWQANVMRRIRDQGPIAPGKSFFIGFEQYVWRLAPAACLVILVLATILFKMDVFPDETVFQVLMNGEEELTISQLVGV